MQRVYSDHGAPDEDVSITTRSMQRLVQPCEPSVTLSQQARMHQALFDWHDAHGQNVSRTCRHFGVSRPTFYRWQLRYVQGRPQTLEDRRRPMATYAGAGQPAPTGGRGTSAAGGA